MACPPPPITPRPPFAPEKKFGVTDKVVCALFGLSPSEHPMTDSCDLPRKEPTDRTGTYDVANHRPRPWTPHPTANPRTLPPTTSPAARTGPGPRGRPRP